MNSPTRNGTVAKQSPEYRLDEPRNFKNRPCDGCRKRKSRCVLNEGAAKCVLCEFHNHQCTFQEDIPPRKRKSITCQDDNLRSPSEFNRRRLSEKSIQVDKRDTSVEDYDLIKGPTLLKRTLGLQRRHHGLYVGSSGRIEPALTTWYTRLDTVKVQQGSSFRQVNDKDMFVLRPDQGTELYAEEVNDLDAIESLVAPNGKALIALYFRIVHPSFPILHKKVYLEKYERTHREFSPVLLAAVYILATDYWSYSPELSGTALPDVDTLEALAFKCLNYAICRPKLSTVEAGLLLLQRPSEKLWPLTAQMVAVGQDLGLHRDCSSWDIPDWEKGLRKRLAWAVFMQDKWASLIQGRPSHISTIDWSVRPLMEQDFPENFADENDEEGSTEVETGRTLYTCMVELTQIVSDIVTSLYSARTAGPGSDHEPQISTTVILMKAKPLQIRLKEWYFNLPHCLKIGYVKFRKLSSIGYLHLAYWATEISLHRSVVRTLSSCADSELIAICQHAAITRSEAAIEFVKSLRPEHWQSFWYFASEYNAGVIGVFEALLSTSLCSEQDISQSRSRLEQYQWTLKMSQKNAGFLSKSIAMIDHATRNLKQQTSSVRECMNENQPRQPDDAAELGRGLLEPVNYPWQDDFDVISPAQQATLSRTETDLFHGINDYGFFEGQSAIEH